MNPADAQELLKEFRYDNVTDTSMRLKGTIIRYRGLPVYVESCYDNLYMMVSPIHDRGNDSPITVHSSDKELDISSVPLGWANFEDYSIFLMRSARNSQKQGMSPSSIVYFDPTVRSDRNTNRFRFENRAELYSIGDCILGKYPSFKTVLKMRSGGAFHMDWAVIRPKRSLSAYFTVYHKTVPVGVFNSKTGRFLFRRGRLTKTRKMSLIECLNHPSNAKEGLIYDIAEQK